MKIKYNGIQFDSELEVDYYKHLQSDFNVLQFWYHLPTPINITRGNTYTPDFVVLYENRIEIIETKGYNPYSKLRDDMIHQVMLSKREADFQDWLEDNGLGYILNGQDIIYRKIKHLAAYGFVDWDFKNPNTIANKRKVKIDEQATELKELRVFKKDALRYFEYKKKIESGLKLTKPQREWIGKYTSKWIYGDIDNE